MTPPIPISGQRKRPSKSCTSCRAAKAKCTGLSEEYLHKVDEPDYEPDPTQPVPRCDRCQRSGSDCNFVPSRRKGRPRRLPRQQPSPSLSPSPSPSPPLGSDGSPDRAYTATSYSSPSGGRDRSSVGTTPSPWTLPTPPSALYSSLPALPVEQIPHLTDASICVPPIVPPDLFQPQHYLQIAHQYLTDAFIWVPILPPDLYQLQHYLQIADPILAAVLTSVLDTSIPPPAFPPTHDISLATLQAGVLLSLLSYGVKDRTRAVETLRWTCEQLRDFGWAGEQTSGINGAIGHAELEAFVGVGWLCWGLEIQLTVLTGNRQRVFASVPPPSVVTPETMILQALALLYDATDFQGLWDGDDEHRRAKTANVLQRADRVHHAAFNYLRASTPPLAPSPQRTPASLQIAATRESVFLAATIAPAAVILFLSSTSPLSPLIAPALPCSLDTTSFPSGPARLAVRHVASQIVTVVRTTPTAEGISIAQQPHSPYWGCCFLITARGLLLQAEAATLSEGAGLTPAETAQLDADLDVCEAVLAQQALKWPSAESLGTEVALLRRTMGTA
ncbi:hypothetical protein JCM21900_001370 [Sporobolomyces salmonicolor]